MRAREVECPKCKAVLPDQPSAAAALEECPSCALKLKLHTFPALFRPLPAGLRGATALTEGEATCFHHEQKRAVTACDECGKFLCQLCDVPVGEQHFCPQCVEAGMTRGRLKQLERGRPRHDLVMLSITVLSLLFWVIPLLPLAVLVIGCWKWKAPRSLVHRTRLRMVIAMVIAALELAGGTVFWVAALTDL